MIPDMAITSILTALEGLLGLKPPYIYTIKLDKISGSYNELFHPEIKPLHQWKRNNEQTLEEKGRQCSY